jgi:cytochrome c oxidase subunit II
MNKIYLLAAVVVLAVAGILFFNQKKPLTKTELTTPTPSISSFPVKEFTMTAKQFQFDPSVITVNQGDRVRIKITSLDVTHGFALPDFNINQTLEPGKEVMVDFIADKKGEYPFHCSVICGEGHKEMTGKLVVN